MRLMLALPLLLAAGCGGDTAPQEKKAARLATLESGQFQLSSEVTTLSSVDQGAPAINTPVGTKAEQSVCIPASGRAPTELFSGEGYDCSYNNYYARNGRINALLTCSRPGLRGEISMTVDGRFESGGQISFNRNVRTILASDGDVLINSRVTGRRTGDCAAGASADGKQTG
jgi:hypothetical protein